jgi:integrase
VFWVCFRDSLGRWRWHPGGASVAEAEQVRAEMIALAKRDVEIPPKQMILVRDAAADWLSEFEAEVEGGKKQRATLERYRQAALLIDGLIGDQRIHNIDRFLVARLAESLRTRGLSPSTCEHALRTLSAILEYTRRHNLLNYNPVLEYRRHVQAARTAGRDRDGRSRGDPEALNEAELRRLLAQAANPWRVAFACMAFLGLRSREVLALQQSDIEGSCVHVRGQLAQGTILEYQAGDPRRRRIAVPHALERELHQVRSTSSTDIEDGLVVSHKGGRPYTARGLDLAFAKAVAAAGLDPALTAADLRRSFAVRRIRSGCDLATLSAELGQAIDSTYRRYASLFEKGGTLAQARAIRREDASRHPPSKTKQDRLIETLDRERLRWSGKRTSLAVGQVARRTGLPLTVVERYSAPMTRSIDGNSTTVLLVPVELIREDRS